jgi:hypothetical protein|tara:strand:- start:6525 stop:7085 length:561 start_codon:yes stop_codon:yes gene_type:complete
MFKKIVIHSFLLTFLLTSCASSGGSSKKSTAAQRAVETREYDVSAKDLMQSTIGAFQDLGFTIDTLNEEFGLVTASKIEKPKKEKPSDAEKALGALAVIGAIWWLIATDGDGPSGRGGRNDGETVVIKDYKLTATATVKAIYETEPYMSSLRINFGGSERKRSIQFFREFFAAIDKSLFLDNSLDS